MSEQTMHREFMAFVEDETSAATVRAWAERQGFPADTVMTGGADLFLTLLESDAPPKLALFDVDGQSSPVQVAARITSLCGPASKLIALGSANDVGLYRSMVAAGLADYLVKPLTPEILTQALLIATRGGVAGALGPKEAKIITMIGVRGGVGASTLAVNTAWILSHEMKHKSALVDLDLQYGTSALALDLEPGHALRDVLSSPQRVDGLMIAGALINENEHFGVLSAEEPIDEQVHVDGAAVSALLKELKTTYHAIIIDLPRHMLPMQKRLLALSTDLVLVTEVSLVGIRDTLRVKTILKAMGAPGRITIVGSPTGPNRPAAVDEASFAKGAQTKVDFKLPEDCKNVIAASNAGKMLPEIAASSALTKTLRTLAKHLIGPESKEQAQGSAGGGLFSSLFGGGKKTADGKTGGERP